MLTRALLVCLGGAAGSLCRYAVGGWITRLTRESPFPWGTLVVNSSGAFLLGILMGATATGPFLVSPRLRVLLSIGFLGAFTTFSTFTYETLEAMRAGDLRVFLANVAASLIMGLAACWVGLAVGQRL